MPFGQINLHVGWFEYAYCLSRGVEKPSESPPVTVSFRQMQVANVISSEILVLMNTIAARGLGNLNLPMGGIQVRSVFDRAHQAVFRLEGETRHALDRGANSLGEVGTLRGGLIEMGLSEFVSAREIMEIAVGERDIEQSQFRSLAIANEIVADVAASMTPILGEMIAIYELSEGRSAIGGRPLSASERAFAGASLILPFALAKLAKPIVLGARITRRTVQLSLEYRKVYGLLDAAKRFDHSFQIALGLRRLPEKPFQELAILSGKLAKGVALTSEELSRLTFFYYRMCEDARSALWVMIVGRELGPSATGFRELRGCAFNQREKEALQRLSAHFQGELIAGLPEVNPIDFPGKVAFGEGIKGVRYPDALWRNETLEVVSLETSSFERAKGQILKKSGQSPNILVDITKDSKLNSKDIQRMLPSLFGNPDASAIQKIIVSDGFDVVIHLRPPEYSPTFFYQLGRPGFTSLVDVNQAIHDVGQDP